MFSRFAVAALLIGAITMPVFAGGDHDNDQDNDLLCVRECQFEVLVPAVLDCSDCVVINGRASILVRTNTCTTVCIEASEFKRFERDCDGNQLSTFDTLPSIISVEFCEAPLCPQEGQGLFNAEPLEGNCWEIESHRGGYEIKINSVLAGAADLCDDAGCYTATVKVIITAQPAECPELD